MKEPHTMTTNVTHIHTTENMGDHPQWCSKTMCSADEDGLVFHALELQASTVIDSNGWDGPQLHPCTLHTLEDIAAREDDLTIFTELRRAYETDTTT